MRPASAGSPSSPKPPASSAGVRPRGSSSSASGLPRVSATMRSRTRSSSGPVRTASSSARASPASSPATTSSASSAKRRSPARLAHGEDQPDRLGLQAARHEGERLRRRRVEPLRVVHDADERPLLRRVRQQAQDRQPDQEAVRGVAVAQPERGAERVALRAGEALEPIHAAARRASCSPANASSISDSTPAARTTWHPEARADQVLEQRALARAGLAAEHQRPAQARRARSPAADPAPRTRCAGRADHPWL